MEIPRELRELVEQFAKGNGAIFVGIDLSVDAGLPDKQQLYRSLTADLPFPPPLPFFQEAAQFYQNEYGRQRLIERLRDELAINHLQPTEAHRALVNLPINLIFTSNYDDLIKEALKTARRSYAQVVSDSDFNFLSKEQLQLVKLHGDLERHESLVITARDYEEYFDKHTDFTRSLSVALKQFTILFLGDPGYDDPNFRQLLTQIRNESGKFARNAFAVLFDANEGVIRDLQRRGIQVFNLKTNPGTPDGTQAYQARNQILCRWLNELNQYIASLKPPSIPATPPKPKLPADPLRHRMRLYNLGAGEAHTAIALPARDFGIPIEPALLDQLVNDLNQSDVAPPQLQIVCFELWQDWREQSKPECGWTLQRYQELGATSAILAGYLDRVIAELGKPELRQKIGLSLEAAKAQEAARALLKGMLSADRTKFAANQRELTQNELVSRAGISAAEAKILLAYLTNQRIIRRLADGDRYELAHEVMVEKVWQWVSDEERQLLSLRDLLARATSDYRAFKSLLTLDRLTLLTEQAASLEPSAESSELLLLSAIEHHLDPTVWVSKMETEQALAILSAALPAAKRAQLPQLVRSLGATKSAKALRHLQLLLQNEHDEVQRAVIEAMVMLGAAASTQAIYRALQQEDRLVRITPLIDALEQINSPESVSRLLFIATEHTNQHVRNRAASALLRLEHPLEMRFLIMQMENDEEMQQSVLRVLGGLLAKAPQEVESILYGDNLDLRFAMIRALDKLKDPTTIDLLLPLLDDENLDIRIAALDVSGGLSNPQAVEPLLSLLKDTNSEVYLAAIRALGNVWKIPAITQLGSADARMRSTAANALGQQDEKRAIEPLLALLKDDNKAVRQEAADALGKLGDATVRKTTAIALGKLGDARAVEPLLALLKDDNTEVCREAADALGKLGYTTVRKTAAIALGKLGDARAVEPLLALLKDDNTEVRREAAYALGRLGNARAVEPLLVLLKHDSAAVCREAACALGKLGDTQAVEPLLVLLKRDNVAVRREAAIALGKLGDARAVEPLMALLKHDNKAVRREAAIALGKMGDARAVEPLTALLKDDNVAVRREAAYALGKLGDTQAVEPLLVLLECDNVAVRREATIVLGKLGDARAVEPLLALLKDDNKAVCREAAYALGKLGDATVRKTAAIVLGKLGDARAVEPLLALLKDDNIEVRSRVASMLGKLGDARAIKPLLPLLEDKDAQVYNMAVIALRNLGHKLAIEPFETLIDDENPTLFT